MDVLTFIIVAICGLGIGVLSGMFGIGGGGLIVPMLHMAFGLPIIGATSTSLLTIAPTGISGSIKHIRQKTLDIKVGLSLGCAGAVASVGGSFVADSLPDYLVVVLTVTVILFSVSMMVRTIFKDRNNNKTDAPANPKDTGDESVTTDPFASDEEPNGEEDEQPSLHSRIKPVLIPLIIGLIAGGIAGIVGVGGGFIIVPFCVAYLGFSLKKASGTSLLAIAIIAIPGIFSHAILGHIWWLYGLAIVMGTIPGAQIGAWLIAKLPERPMRIAFACLLATLGIMMLVQEFVF